MLDEVGIELYESAFGTPKIPTPSMLRAIIKAASESGEPHHFSLGVLDQRYYTGKFSSQNVTLLTIPRSSGLAARPSPVVLNAV